MPIAWISYVIFFFFNKMALTVDQVLERIGSLGFYQIRLIFILGYIEWFNITFQVLVPTFIAAEPNWLCVANHSSCNLTGEFKPGDKLYNERCDMPRDAWKFADGFTSVVTQARNKNEKIYGF